MRGVADDLTGQRFGRRVVLGRADAPKPRAEDHNTYWLVRCDCGVEQTIRCQTVKRTKRCRACFIKRDTIDLLGRTFGLGTVIGRAPRASRAASGAYWLVRCACGTERVVYGNMLRKGRSNGCRACVKRGRTRLTQQLAEVLVLAAEHATITPVFVREELGYTARAVWGSLHHAARKGLLSHPTEGVYALAPDGLALLRDVAEGRRADRWKLRGEIVAALDGGRASGRSTVRKGIAA